ncbi:6-pyruvoyl tetrahydropterin synthase [Rickettsiales endosymbiont of Paramecium tredecaurelia]|uniref:6-pyruvoyl trahydropterin synthase family protein n=1 Tax=Candidatus Sarmatiella mevalonica TaxID=2770581 RepID=UPI00192236F0|nr:6-carboxytetrahydropterin synthase [Candidatus Sarmatiella mevalonica]MBL3285034.1 6-pyruvoyl tetrahydropterin synthase [Candidatus Sarmatiella mevalonica]
MAYSCTRKIEFDAAHRVVDHKSGCRFVHGHRYVLEVTLISKELDALGMVSDFQDIKKLVKDWIDQYLDHNLILSKVDKELGDFVQTYTGQRVYYLENNPTAENIVAHLMQVLPGVLGLPDAQAASVERKIELKLKLFETPNCSVEI